MVGAAGDDKVPDEGNIRNLISQMAGKIQGHLPQQLTEPLRNEQLRDMADLVGIDSAPHAKRTRKGCQNDPKNPGAQEATVAPARGLPGTPVKTPNTREKADGPGAE